ncbi:MAG TPA: hypothetical protein PLB92_00190 [Rhodoglobus sp.]|nr:hypothetical protein [Rhodoglobus sp.]
MSTVTKPITPGKLFKDHNGSLYISVTPKSFSIIRDYTGYPVFKAERREWTSMEQTWLDNLEVLDL